MGRATAVKTVKTKLEKLEPITLSEIDAAMDEARQQIVGVTVEGRPAGYFSAAEYAVRFGISRKTAADQLDRRADQGKLVKVRATYRSAGATRTGVLYGLPTRKLGRSADRGGRGGVL